MKKIFMAMALCMTLFFSSTTHADEEGMKAFRESMQAMSQEDDRVFHQDIIFFAPNFQCELALIGVAEKHEFKSTGELDFWLTNDSGDVTEVAIPFYLQQKLKDMGIYFQLDKKWYKFQSPSVAAATTDTLATPSNDEVAQMISETKDATILRDSDTQRIFLVNIDGNKLADNMKLKAEENPADNGTADDKIVQDKFFQYLDTALRNSDIWYTWTVSKVDGKTKTMSVHLSSLVQEFARAALNDEEQVFDDSIKEILETIAYYSDAKAYTTFLNSDARKKLEIPKNVLKAKSVDNFGDAKK